MKIIALDELSRDAFLLQKTHMRRFKLFLQRTLHTRVASQVPTIEGETTRTREAGLVVIAMHNLEEYIDVEVSGCESYQRISEDT